MKIVKCGKVQGHRSRDYMVIVKGSVQGNRMIVFAETQAEMSGFQGKPVKVTIEEITDAELAGWANSQFDGAPVAPEATITPPAEAEEIPKQVYQDEKTPESDLETPEDAEEKGLVEVEEPVPVTDDDDVQDAKGPTEVEQPEQAPNQVAQGAKLTPGAPPVEPQAGEGGYEVQTPGAAPDFGQVMDAKAQREADLAAVRRLTQKSKPTVPKKLDIATSQSR